MKFPQQKIIILPFKFAKVLSHGFSRLFAAFGSKAGIQNASVKYEVIICFAAALLLTQSCGNSSLPDEKIIVPENMVLIKGGTFQMGTEDGMPSESPVHNVELESFYMDEHEITTADFAKFVAATNYRTDAEKFGWSGVFDFAKGEWKKVDGANWQYPEGGNLAANPDEPVVQISWNDAAAYAKWADKRLPTEAEFEYAARGGLIGKKYSWGNESEPSGKPPANWWQGNFPVENTNEDGFLARAPVKSFAPNGYGLYDMTGNVWEWNADWYADDYYADSPAKNPQGAKNGDERVIRGGSFLCAENFCTNYRVAGRSRATPDSGLNNLGFRCVRDVK